MPKELVLRKSVTREQNVLLAVSSVFSMIP